MLKRFSNVIYYGCTAIAVFWGIVLLDALFTVDESGKVDGELILGCIILAAFSYGIGYAGRYILTGETNKAN